MFSEQLEHFFGFFGVDLEEENSNIFESLFLSTSNFANFRILYHFTFCVGELRNPCCSMLMLPQDVATSNFDESGR